jgi:hypothetical protein
MYAIIGKSNQINAAKIPKKPIIKTNSKEKADFVKQAQFLDGARIII